MLSSTVLEVAIGLMFCFASIAIVSSSLYEAVASLLKLRAKTLLQGVKDLLNNDARLVLGIYNHALVNPRSDGTTTSGDPRVKPSYIDSKNFALAFVETLQGAPGTLDELKAKLDLVPSPQIRALLEGACARADNNMDKLRAELARWFDDGMDRVSGAYKRRSQLWTFLIGLLVAAVFNVDTIRLFEQLWQHPALVSRISVLAMPDAQSAIDQLQTLPIGWQGITRVDLAMVVGWAVTALSALFGAPFWFDNLQKLVNLRGTGQKPEERAHREFSPRRFESIGIERP